MRTRPVGSLRASGWRVVAGSCAAALIGAASVAFGATAAHADDPADLSVKVSSKDIKLAVGGDQQVVSMTVRNDGPAGVSSPTLTIAIPLTSLGVTVRGTQPVTCVADAGPASLTCQLPAMSPGQTVPFELALLPPSEGLADGVPVREDGTFTISNPNGQDPNDQNNASSFRATLSTVTNGVTEVSGTVVDGSANSPLGGVRVSIKDSAGVQGDATTDSQGQFSYRPDARRPLKSGSLTVDATKDGFDVGHTVIDGSSGGSVTGIQLAVSPVAPSPSPSPPAAPSPVASPAPAAQKVQADSGDSSSSTLLVIVMVSVLSTVVLTGAGLWIGLRRNRDNDANRPPDGPTVRISDDDLRRALGTPGQQPGPRVDGATQVIGSQGAYQPAAGGYQPAAGGYQPAAGGYQPAAGGYQPASGGYSSARPAEYPPTPQAGPAYPPPPDRTTVYSQEAPQPAYPPPPPPDALFGAVPNAAGHETTALTPPSGPSGSYGGRPESPVSGSPTSPFGVSPERPFGPPPEAARTERAGAYNAAVEDRGHSFGDGAPTGEAPAESPWHSDPLTAPMQQQPADEETSPPGIRQSQWPPEEPPGQGPRP